MNPSLPAIHRMERLDNNLRGRAQGLGRTKCDDLFVKVFKQRIYSILLWQNTTSNDSCLTIKNLCGHIKTTCLREVSNVNLLSAMLYCLDCYKSVPSFYHLHYNAIQRGCEAISKTTEQPETALHIAYILEYIVMEMRSDKPTWKGLFRRNCWLTFGKVFAKFRSVFLLKFVRKTVHEDTHCFMSCTKSSQSYPQGLLLSTNIHLAQPQKKHFMIECASVQD